MGMYKYKPTLAEHYAEDNTLFAGLAIPQGLDAATLIRMLLVELGELDTVIADTAELKAYITVWSSIHLQPWNKMYVALGAVYNPIHNYDRIDTETEGTSTQGSSTLSGSSHGSGNSTRNTNRQGFNSVDYVPSDQDVEEQSSNTEQVSAGTSSGESQRARTLESSGNIGVTTSQQMIEAEIELRCKYNLYGIICENFRHDLCVGVW